MLLVVAVAVGVLMGSCYLLLATNLGARLGFLLALTALFGWLTIMSLTWSIYGIGKQGPAPHWIVQETNFNNLAVAQTQVVHGLPPIPKLPTADHFLHHSSFSPFLETQFPPNPAIKPPQLNDELSVDPALEKTIKTYLPKGWKLLATSDPVSADAGSSASTYLVAQNTTYNDQSQFVILGVYSYGGKRQRGPGVCGLSKPSTYGTCLRRARFKIGRVLTWVGGQPPHYVVVQVQSVLNQPTLPGKPPPLSKPDPKADVESVVMLRDEGGFRVPSEGLLFFSALMFAICCNSLHRRDKLVAAARAAAAKA